MSREAKEAPGGPISKAASSVISPMGVFAARDRAYCAIMAKREEGLGPWDAQTFASEISARAKASYAQVLSLMDDLERRGIFGHGNQQVFFLP